MGRMERESGMGDSDWLIVLGGICGIVGSFLPWASADFLGSSGSVGGFEFYGEVTFTIALVSLLLSLQPSRSFNGDLFLFFGFIGGLVVGYHMVTIPETVGYVEINLGYGIYLTLIGFIMVAVGGLIRDDDVSSSGKYGTVPGTKDTVLVDVKATLLDRNPGGVIAEETFIKSFPFRDFVDDSEGSMGGVRVVLGPVFNDGRGPRCSGSFDAVYRKDLFDRVCDALEREGWHSNTRHAQEEGYPYPEGPDAPPRPEIKTSHIVIVLLATLFLVALLMVMV